MTGFSSAPPPEAMSAPPPDLVQQPQKEPVSSFSFPPGLLPGLCRAKREAGAQAYEPLEPDEIERIGLPPPPTKDDYLGSRLERFFAECRDYRPGLTRADIEDPNHSWHRQRLKQEYEQDPEGLKQRWWRGGGRRHTGGRGEPGKVHADGTYTGGGSQYAGLGVHMATNDNKPKPASDADLPAGLGSTPAAAPGGTMSFEDMYASYRNQRSGGYHAMIMANAAKSHAMSVVPRGLPHPAAGAAARTGSGGP